MGEGRSAPTTVIFVRHWILYEREGNALAGVSCLGSIEGIDKFWIVVLYWLDAF
jgi:hypothetical protein